MGRLNKKMDYNDKIANLDFSKTNLTFENNYRNFNKSFTDGLKRYY